MVSARLSLGLSGASSRYASRKEPAVRNGAQRDSVAAMGSSYAPLVRAAEWSQSTCTTWAVVMPPSSCMRDCTFSSTLI